MNRKEKRYPRYINKGNKQYRHQGGNRYCSDDGDLLDTMIVLAVLNGNESSYGCTSSRDFSEFSPGGGEFGGAGASASWSDSSSHSGASDSGGGDAGGGGDGGGGGGGGD